MTCGQLWCPNHTLDITTTIAHGEVINGERRTFTANEKDGCNGKYKDANIIYVAK